MVIYDYDGPRAADGAPQCVDLTAEVLRAAINDERFPFGHGYCVGAMLAGMPVPID